MVPVYVPTASINGHRRIFWPSAPTRFPVVMGVHNYEALGYDFFLNVLFGQEKGSTIS
jgi:hypothetical protein